MYDKRFKAALNASCRSFLSSASSGDGSGEGVLSESSSVLLPEALRAWLSAVFLVIAVSHARKLPFSPSNCPIFSHTRIETSERQSSLSCGFCRIGAMMYRMSGP